MATEIILIRIGGALDLQTHLEINIVVEVVVTPLFCVLVSFVMCVVMKDCYLISRQRKPILRFGS